MKLYKEFYSKAQVP